MNNEKILSYLGLAAAARKIVFGTDAVLAEIRKAKKNTCVIVANDASPRTAKQIFDKCNFYKVPLIKPHIDMYELAHRVGKLHPTACLAVTDASLSAQIIKYSES